MDAGSRVDLGSYRPGHSAARHLDGCGFCENLVILRQGVQLLSSRWQLGGERQSYMCSFICIALSRIYLAGYENYS